MARVEARPMLNLPDAETVQEWRGVLAGLADQEGTLETELETVREERRGIALDIARGEPAAAKRNEALNARQVELMAKLDLLLVIRNVAQEKLVEAQAVEADAVAEARRVEGRGIALELLEASRQADAAMREAASALTQRETLARRLAGHGASLNGLTNRARIAAAAGHAGLGDQLSIRRSPRPLYATLGDMDAKLLRGLLGEAAPEEAPADPRAVPRQLGAFETARPAAPAVEHDPAVRW
jgi:hypothetical protein